MHYFNKSTRLGSKRFFRIKRLIVSGWQSRSCTDASSSSTLLFFKWLQGRGWNIFPAAEWHFLFSLLIMLLLSYYWFIFLTWIYWFNPIRTERYWSRTTSHRLTLFTGTFHSFYKRTKCGGVCFLYIFWYFGISDRCVCEVVLCSRTYMFYVSHNKLSTLISCILTDPWSDHTMHIWGLGVRTRCA